MFRADSSSFRFAHVCLIYKDQRRKMKESKERKKCVPLDTATSDTLLINYIGQKFPCLVCEEDMQ